MGACPKCGKPRVRKRKDRTRVCPRCGPLNPSQTFDRPAPAVTARPMIETMISSSRLKVRWRADDEPKQLTRGHQ